MSDPTVEIHVKAIDEATAAIKTMEGKITGTMSTIESANSRLEESTKKVKTSVTDTITSFANIANGAVALYGSYKRINDAGLTLETANLRVDKATRTVKDAQDKYNGALQKFGEGSPQVLEAATNLQIAQDGLEIATKKANDAQDNLNLTLVTSTITSITGVIGIVGNVKKAFSGWGDMIDTVVSKLSGIGSKATSALDSLAEIGGAGGGVAGGGAEGMSILGGGGAAIGGALAATAAVALTPLLADFAGKQEAAIAANENLADLMTIRGGGAMATGTNPWTNTVSKLAQEIAIVNEVSDKIAAVVAEVSNISPLERLPGVPGRFQHGGIVTSPTYGLVGEAGPEAIIPLTRGLNLGAQIVINGPLVNIEGTPDKATINAAVHEVQRMLKSVLVEASSSDALSTHKRIRFGNVRSYS